MNQESPGFIHGNVKFWEVFGINRIEPLYKQYNEDLQNNASDEEIAEIRKSALSIVDTISMTVEHCNSDMDANSNYEYCNKEYVMNKLYSTSTKALLVLHYILGNIKDAPQFFK